MYDDIDRFMKRLFTALFVFFALMILSIPACIVTASYTSGKAKSAWLKQTRGIDMPWWQAQAMDIDIHDADANVKLEN